MTDIVKPATAAKAKRITPSGGGHLL